MIIILHIVYLHLSLLPSQSNVEHIQNFFQILTKTEYSSQLKIHWNNIKSPRY